MPGFYRKKRKVALPPGTLEPPAGEVQKSKIYLIDYTENEFQEKELASVEEAYRYKETPTVSWVNIDGRDVNVIRKIDRHFGIHPLVLEDIINLGQRPKVEDYEDYVFLVLKMLRLDEKSDDIYAEQIGLVLGRNFVISFQEEGGDVFDSIRSRLREKKGRIRQMGADYLAYSLLDAIVDNYFIILERIGEKIDQLERKLFSQTTSEIPYEIHKLKSKIIYLRKQIWPLREVLGSILRGESNLILKETMIYLRDVYDHTIQVNDTIEALRESLSGMQDIYLSSTSHRLNEVMMVLTVFSAIFIPLTFIVGVYGMNFEYMPELKWKSGYFILWGIMIAVTLVMVRYFKRKKWI